MCAQCDRRCRVRRRAADWPLSNSAVARLRRRASTRRLRHTGDRLCRTGACPRLEPRARRTGPGLQRRPFGEYGRRTSLWSTRRPHRAQALHRPQYRRLRPRDACHSLRPGHRRPSLHPLSHRSWPWRRPTKRDRARFGIQPRSPARDHGHGNVRRIFCRFCAQRAGRSSADPNLRLAIRLLDRRYCAAAHGSVPRRPPARVPSVSSRSPAEQTCAWPSS